MKIDWKAKLSSRKFWAMLIGCITSVLTAFNVSDTVIAPIVAAITSSGAVIVYMLAEAYVDGRRAGAVKETE